MIFSFGLSPGRRAELGRDSQDEGVRPELPRADPTDSADLAELGIPPERLESGSERAELGRDVGRESSEGLQASFVSILGLSFVGSFSEGMVTRGFPRAEPDTPGLGRESLCIHLGCTDGRVERVLRASMFPLQLKTVCNETVCSEE